MGTARHVRLLGKHVLVAFRTVHIDRAGETGTQVEKFGEVVAVEPRGWAVIVTEEGEHVRFPVGSLYPARPEGYRPASLGRVVRPDFIGAEELIRDFHSATRPVVLRRIDHRTAPDESFD